MKTFEEKWTAWIDGKLDPAEAAAFEASLEDRTSAETEKIQAHKLGALLRAALQPLPMGNEEFFHHQLRMRIAADTPPPHTDRTSKMRESWWTIRRLLWAGAGSLAVFAVFMVAVMRQKPEPDQSQYLSQILNARVDPGVNPYATVSIFQTKQDNVTVLWVDGLKSLPADYAAK